MSGIVGKTAMPKTGRLLVIAQRRVFPFILLRLRRGRKGATAPSVVDLKVDDEVYEYLTSTFGTDELIMYLDPANGKTEVWTPAMHSTFELMRELGLMESGNTWIQKARPFLKKTLTQALSLIR